MRRKAESIKKQRKERNQLYLHVTSGKTAPGTKRRGRPASEHIDKLLKSEDLWTLSLLLNAVWFSSSSPHVAYNTMAFFI